MPAQHYVFFNQYYPPDLAPTGMVLRDVAEEMAAQGHRVTIICSKGGYSGIAQSDQASANVHASLRVIRLPSFRFGRKNSLGKLCDYLSFYILAFWYGLTVRGRPTRYIALTTPPYLSVLARIVSKFRRATHAHWVMDLYPDVMVAHGILKSGGMKAKILLAISRWGFGGRRSRRVVSLGPDMASRLKNGHKVEGGSWVPLWSTAEQDESASEKSESLRKERGWEEKTVFLYSGNMGLGHRISDFLKLAKENQDQQDVIFAFYGGGKRKSEVESFIARYPEVGLEVGDYVPEDLLAAHLQSADVHLASLEPSWDGCMVPSKIQGIFASGRPVLFLGSTSSAIGNWVLEAGGGWVAPPGDDSALQAAYIEALNPEQRAQKGRNAATFSEDQFRRRENAIKTSRELGSGS